MAEKEVEVVFTTFAKRFEAKPGDRKKVAVAIARGLVRSGAATYATEKAEKASAPK